MHVDKFGRMSETNLTSVDGVSVEYINHNFLPKNYSTDMNGQKIPNQAPAQNGSDIVTKD